MKNIALKSPVSDITEFKLVNPPIAKAAKLLPISNSIPLIITEKMLLCVTYVMKKKKKKKKKLVLKREN